MTDKEVLEMQVRIDEGIRLAQERLWKRAGRDGNTLVVVRDGKLQEVAPRSLCACTQQDRESDPLDKLP